MLKNVVSREYNFFFIFFFQSTKTSKQILLLGLEIVKIKFLSQRRAVIRKMTKTKILGTVLEDFQWIQTSHQILLQN